MNQFLLSIGLMAVTWVVICIVGHGYANTVDHVAYILHKHAEKMRQMHSRRKAVISERWVRSLEQCVIDVLEETKYDAER